MLSRTLLLIGVCAFTLLSSYSCTRASSRSAMWNILIGGVVVLILAIVLLFTSLALVRRAFG